MSRPFSRALQMMALISAAMQSAAPQIALSKIGPYRSRGKGRGSRGTKADSKRGRPVTNWCNLSRTRATGTNGPREMARRVRQMERTAA